ncbi:hypothetical protein GR925_01330 [Streptomyces sp. HUCO-GS316]|uniref:hypothetical protein n=1 Tax=Streptomyces sp. HUCO-GS316 TaxID=2692198 RepID=UPI00136EF0F2|nr:hypothetical protein [Streptomyces sp. HUCO-GS316]MXM62126.1 hypothetical protein [Streptomyces sp. HUCO-GS316]
MGKRGKRNNSVTVLAEVAQIAGEEIAEEDLQIVNRLQTSHEIYSYMQNGGQHPDRSLAPGQDGRAVDCRVRPTACVPSEGLHQPRTN